MFMPPPRPNNIPVALPETTSPPFFALPPEISGLALDTREGVFRIIRELLPEIMPLNRLRQLMQQLEVQHRLTTDHLQQRFALFPRARAEIAALSDQDFLPPKSPPLIGLPQQVRKMVATAREWATFYRALSRLSD